MLSNDGDAGQLRGRRLSADAIRSDMHDFQSKFFASSPESRTVTDNWLSLKDALSSSRAKHVPTKLVKSSDKQSRQHHSN